MSTLILIGNLISCGAAVFTALSSLSKGEKKIYGFQALQCFTMAIASIFFTSFSGITTFLVCGARNCFAAAGKYSKKVYLFFLTVTVILGLAFNNRGLTGLLPIVTTVIYTTGQYYLKTELLIKANIALNLILWVIYDVIVMDYVSAVVDLITVGITILALVRAGSDMK